MDIEVMCTVTDYEANPAMAEEHLERVGREIAYRNGRTVREYLKAAPAERAPGCCVIRVVSMGDKVQFGEAS